MLKAIPKEYFDGNRGTLKLLWEEEWRALGITQSLGWEHYEVHEPEPHILLFKYVFELVLHTRALANKTFAGARSIINLPPTKLFFQPYIISLYSAYTTALLAKGIMFTQSTRTSLRVLQRCRPFERHRP